MSERLDKVEIIEFKALLFDFYGELLTEKQKTAYEDHICNDLSLSEIAQDYGVSRQAAHDLIKRTDKILSEYESKLHLVERFLTIKSQVREMAASDDIERIHQLAAHILEEL